jgi:hypothetical protein
MEGGATWAIVVAAWVCSWAEDRLGRSSSPANNNPSANARATNPPNFNQLSDRADIERSFESVGVMLPQGNLTVQEGGMVSFGQNALVVNEAKGP